MLSLTSAAARDPQDVGSAGEAGCRKPAFACLVWWAPLFLVGCVDAASGPTEQPDAGQDPTEALFDREHLIEVEVAPADWDLVRSEGRGLTQTMTGCARDYNYTYVSARVTVDGQSYDDVAVRKKGFLGSLSTHRPSLKLNFGKFDEGRTHAGMKRMTLNNNAQDPSNTHQCMAYALFERAGSIAPRCNFAHVVVNGEDLGIYTHVESIKKPMIARHFVNNDGNLYEGQTTDFVAVHRDELELKTNEIENDRSDFDRLTTALEASDDQLLETLGEVLDIDAFLTFWSMEVITGHWDSYSGNRNNYLAYHDPTSRRFYFIPWGTDGSFSGQRLFNPVNTARSVLAEGAVANRLYNHPAGRTLYFERLAELFDQVWDEQALLDETDRIGALTNAFGSSIDSQREFIVEHGEMLRRELGMAPVEWFDGRVPGPSQCMSDVTTNAAGTFSTTWIGRPVPGQSVELTLNGQPWRPFQLLGQAGYDDTDPNKANVGLLAPQPDETYLVLLLRIPLVYFTVGEHLMHGFETNAILVRFNPADTSATILAFVGEGRLTLSAASTELGGAVSGSFEGELLQVQPL